MPDYKIGDKVPLPPKEGSRRMRDVVPNGDDFRSRIYSAHRANARDGLPRGEGEPSINAASTNSMFMGIGREKVSCPECGAEPGQPCTSVAKDPKKHGKEMPTIHGKRFAMAKRVFGRKEKA
jgi:hypothetical protein